MARFTLRQLPLPAKLVVSAFLISVGVGYFSALVQLHMQHGDRDGHALPTPADVIERFSGLKEYDGTRPVSKIEGLINGDPDGDFTSANMAVAFFRKSSGYEKECKERTKEEIDSERDGERKLLTAWLNLEPPQKRREVYEANAMPLPEAMAGQPLTASYLKADGKVVEVQTLFEERCLKCHGAGGSNKPEMDTYDKLLKYATPPPLDVIDGHWVKSSKQTSVEGLTQSTHAHLLSFSMLFGLTGLTFALSSYAGLLRGLLGPLVLVAQLADISCWWLARLEGVGPLFAQAIMGTGGVVGLGLSLQIVLSLFDMYGVKGKAVLLLIALASAGGFGVLAVRVIEPALAAEKAKKRAEPPLVDAAIKDEARKGLKPPEPAPAGPGEIPKAKD